MKPGEIEIEVGPRAHTNPGLLRRQKFVPGVIYGTTMKNSLSFQADEKTLAKYGAHQYENTIFKLKSAQKDLNGVFVLIKEISRHPVNQKPLSIDLLAIDLNKPVKVAIELKFEGKAAGIADGGVLQPIMRELEVWCLPAKIPESLSVDVSPLGINQSLHIQDIKLPEGVEAASSENLTIVTVAFIKEEAVVPVAAAAGAEGAAPAEPEVIQKGKKAEEGAADAAKKPEGKK